ncbi:MAG: hypothetical protein HY854_13250 [Burkholderiales bacterium]|nr:hypothetical protein [Burkholderiales bacterium]
MRNSFFSRLAVLAVSITITALVFQAVALLGHPEEVASLQPAAPARVA